MATHSEVLALRSYTFQPCTRASAVAFNHSDYSYSQYPQGTASADLALLANQFNRHSLRPETNQYTSQQQHIRHTAQHPISPPPQKNFPGRLIAESRTQRQATAMLQCQASHARQMSILLEHMIASASEWEEDETLGEMDDEDDVLNRPTLTYRRSADLSNQQGYVNKTIRVRKRRQVRRLEVQL